MCGVVGFLQGRRRLADAGRVVGVMAEALRHRGPDAGGIWCNDPSGIALGHRRLAILDVSDAGAQPMSSQDGRWVVVYNGEIYNAPELRQELIAEGVVFRGHSDTEVLVEGLARWGLPSLLKRLSGMFAFAAWDCRARRLLLARDRIGIKPLYWAQVDDMFLFASELKALNPHPRWQPSLDHDAIAAYMRFSCIPAPRSIWKEAKKVAPGSFLTLEVGKPPIETPYWSLDEEVTAGRQNPWNGSDQDAIESLDALLRKAVARHMISDVPLGAFLSGGIDSSLVSALMQTQNSERIKTFSIGFHEPEYNEAEYALKVAQHLGTDHTELYVQPRDALDVVPNLSQWYDEPFADVSQIPTYLVSQLARRHVTVALSGDGGDEIFAGYRRYAYCMFFNKMTKTIPAPMHPMMAALLRSRAGRAGRNLVARLPRRYGERCRQGISMLQNIFEGVPGKAYREMFNFWSYPEAALLQGTEAEDLFTDRSLAARMPDFLAHMQYLDSRVYLPDDILTKVDRASMAVSLEARIPLLDPEVIRFAWRLPPRLRNHRGKGKRLLRQLLHRYVPPALVERPKMGFGVPIDAWLRGPLKEWAWSRLSPDAIRRHGVLRPEAIEAAWQSHQSGRRDLQYSLWTALMLQDWLENNRHGRDNGE